MVLEAAEKESKWIVAREDNFGDTRIFPAKIRCYIYYMNSKQLGALGEKIAEEYLKNKGYKILDKNYTVKFRTGPKIGEIDIIAKERDLICFIEVKTLSDSNSFFSPESKVDYFKKRKIIKVARNWLMEKRIPLETKQRLEVVAIKIDLIKKKAKIKHFQNVF